MNQPYTSSFTDPHLSPCWTWRRGGRVTFTLMTWKSIFGIVKLIQNKKFCVGDGFPFPWSPLIPKTCFMSFFDPQNLFLFYIDPQN
jgi:hypothetical protein